MWLQPKRLFPWCSRMKRKSPAGGDRASSVRPSTRRWFASTGFSGSYSSIRRFLQGLEQTHPRVTTVLDFSPGDVAQVDFGAGPRIQDVHTGQVCATWVFVMVLAWSRHQYAAFVTDQKVATWLLCHRHAFEFFAGVPKRVMIDNPKSAITRACYYDPGVQRAYAACAEGYGFLISPCPPRDPRKKGRVEAGVKYVKKNFLPLRDFRSVADANAQLREWVLSIAGNRIHGTTQEKPLNRFAQTERHPPHAIARYPPGSSVLDPRQSARRLPRAVRKVPLQCAFSPRAPRPLAVGRIHHSPDLQGSTNGGRPSLCAPSRRSFHGG